MDWPFFQKLDTQLREQDSIRTSIRVRVFPIRVRDVDAVPSNRLLVDLYEILDSNQSKAVFSELSFLSFKWFISSPWILLSMTFLESLIKPSVEEAVEDVKCLFIRASQVTSLQYVALSRISSSAQCSQRLALF
jgi:hypothetical protein